MSEEIAYWKARFAAVDLTDSVVRWLLTHAATVFMGYKSGELLALDAAEFSMDANTMCAKIEAMAREWGLSVAIMRVDGTRLKFVVYGARRVDEDLGRVPAWALRRLKYDTPIPAQAFFAEVARRWNASGAIPHEVGFGLGYPAKDVLGYLGLVDLDHTLECGWRVYGPAGASLERSRRFARAKAVACACLA